MGPQGGDHTGFAILWSLQHHILKDFPPLELDTSGPKLIHVGPSCPYFLHYSSTITYHKAPPASCPTASPFLPQLQQTSHENTQPQGPFAPAVHNALQILAQLNPVGRSVPCPIPIKVSVITSGIFLEQLRASPPTLAWSPYNKDTSNHPAGVLQVMLSDTHY